MDIDPQIAEALAVTAELTGTQISPGAARVLAQDLAAYPKAQLLGALSRCRRELKGRLTVAEIVNRLDDGRPGPDEAWAMIPRGEEETTVWTEEMATAYGAAAPALADGDRAAGRAAFREAYIAAVADARANAKPVAWQVSLGHNRAGREGAILEAVQKGRLTHAQAERYLPNPEALANIAGPASLQSLMAGVLERMDSGDDDPPEGQQ